MESLYFLRDFQDAKSVPLIPLPHHSASQRLLPLFHCLLTGCYFFVFWEQFQWWIPGNKPHRLISSCSGQFFARTHSGCWEAAGEHVDQYATSEALYSLLCRCGFTEKVCVVLKVNKSVNIVKGLLQIWQGATAELTLTEFNFFSSRNSGFEHFQWEKSYIHVLCFHSYYAFTYYRMRYTY